MLNRYTIAETSMSPLLKENDYVVTIRRRPAFGDVVVFEHPNRPRFHLVKRVIGTAAQTVEIRGGLVLVDGQEINDPWTADETGPEGSWHVPDGHVFVLGDARHRSTDDSRSFGPVSIGIKAQVVAVRYWPLKRIAVFRTRSQVHRR